MVGEGNRLHNQVVRAESIGSFQEITRIYGGMGDGRLEMVGVFYIGTA